MIATDPSAGCCSVCPCSSTTNIEIAAPRFATAGSIALLDNVTSRDAPLVARLRDAGAIILGKTYALLADPCLQLVARLRSLKAGPRAFQSRPRALSFWP